MKSKVFSETSTLGIHYGSGQCEVPSKREGVDRLGVVVRVTMFSRQQCTSLRSGQC